MNLIAILNRDAEARRLFYWIEFHFEPFGYLADGTAYSKGHCCPVKSRIESIGWGHRGIRFGSRMAGVPVKRAFFRIA